MRPALETKEALLLKGVRRSGKSTLMAQLIRFLLEQGKEPARILRVNLEEPLFAAEYSNELLERIYRIDPEHAAPPVDATCFSMRSRTWTAGRSGSVPGEKPNR